MEKILENLSKKITEVYEKLYSLGVEAEKKGTVSLAKKLSRIGNKTEQISIEIDKLLLPPPKS